MQTKEDVKTPARNHFLDWVRLIALLGITVAHTVSLEDSGMVLFWLSDTIAPFLFVALIGVTSSLSRKTNLETLVYSLTIFVLGVAMSAAGGMVIPVLQTLAVCMVVAKLLPNKVSLVLASWAVYFLASFVVWKTVDITGTECYMLGEAGCSVSEGLGTWLFYGAYSVISWVPMTLSAKLIYTQRKPWMMWCGLLLIPGLYVVGTTIQPIGSFALTKSAGFSYLEAMGAVHSHMNSFASMVLGLSAFLFLAGLSCVVGGRAPKAPVLSRMSLTGYMIGWLVLFFLPQGWGTLAITVFLMFLVSFVFAKSPHGGPVEILAGLPHRGVTRVLESQGAQSVQSENHLG